MAEHTPIPWRIRGREGLPNCYIVAVETDDEPIDDAVHEFDHLIATLEPDSELGGYGTMEGNAELIRRACNIHEELVAVCKLMWAELEVADDEQRMPVLTLEEVDRIEVVIAQVE